ncbi:MAG: KEOPS complex subunit Pcc1 [Candidatus Hodarchaeales archaeon]|jgi:tRNA threonylcarbamoyladenosine modification (KEOPS) complex  Pcc1 subunit
MKPKICLTIEVSFDSKEESRLVHDSLIPEIMDHDFDRSQVFIEVNELNVIVNIKSQDVAAARANFNSILRWISLVSESTHLITKKNVIKYS